MAKLEVEISGDIKRLESALKKAQADLKSLDSQSIKSGAKIERSGKKAAKGIEKLGKSTANGSSAMTAFSRTIQDAPFGIMGVSNNITNLTEQFGYLKRSTGSSGGALRAMIKDLKGFGGITLGISIVTSLLVAFGDKIFKAKDRVKDLKKEQEELTKSLENYALGLEAVNRANLKGSQNAVKEAVNLRLLVAQVENTTLSNKERTAAIDELRKKYPEYLRQITNEKALNGGLSLVYNQLTESIKKRAKATASMNAIIKNSEILLSLESQLIAKTDALKKEQDRLNESLEQTTKLAGSNPLAVLAKSGAGAASKVNKLKGEVNSLVGEIQNLELAIIDLENNIDATGGIAGIVRGSGQRQTATTIGGGLQPVGLQGVSGGLSGPTPEMQEGLNRVDEFKTRMQEKLLDFNDAIHQIIQNNIFNTFIGIGEAIGNALSGALNLGDGLAKVLLSSMGSLLKQLGIQALIVGLTLEKVKLALATLNGGLAIAAGIAAIAIGSAFTNASQGIGSSMGGGGGVAGGGSSRGRSFGGGSGPGGIANQNLTFTIRGTDLVAVLNNTLNQNGIFGGNVSVSGG